MVVCVFGWVGGFFGELGGVGGWYVGVGGVFGGDLVVEDCYFSLAGLYRILASPAQKAQCLPRGQRS